MARPVIVPIAALVVAVSRFWPPTRPLHCRLPFAYQRRRRPGPPTASAVVCQQLSDRGEVLVTASTATTSVSQLGDMISTGRRGTR
jgi:hypothetical protein